MSERRTTEAPTFSRPDDDWLRWLCLHPTHSLAMVEIEGLFCPVIVDAEGRGPICPPELGFVGEGDRDRGR